MPLPTDPAQIAANIAKAQATIAALRESAGELKQDWLDAELWAELAANRKLVLPATYLRPTPELIRRYCRKLGITAKEFLEWGGYAELEDFASKNPRWPLRALVGVLLEYVEERDGARQSLRDKLSDHLPGAGRV